MRTLNDKVASYGKMPNKGTTKCKVPETGLTVTCSRDMEGTVAEVQATRREGRQEMGCKAPKEDREGPHGP